MLPFTLSASLLAPLSTDRYFSLLFKVYWIKPQKAEIDNRNCRTSQAFQFSDYTVKTDKNIFLKTKN